MSTQSFVVIKFQVVVFLLIFVIHLVFLHILKYNSNQDCSYDCGHGNADDDSHDGSGAQTPVRITRAGTKRRRWRGSGCRCCRCGWKCDQCFVLRFCMFLSSSGSKMFLSIKCQMLEFSRNYAKLAMSTAEADVGSSRTEGNFFCWIYFAIPHVRHYCQHCQLCAIKEKLECTENLGHQGKTWMYGELGTLRKNLNVRRTWNIKSIWKRRTTMQ